MSEQQAASLAEVFENLELLCATNPRDWGARWDDAWLYAILVGWDCEKTVHDGTCTHGAMEEMAARYGWSAELVERLRGFRAAVRAVSVPPVRPGEETTP